MFWSLGADRSAASALPLLLLSPILLKRSGLKHLEVEQALIRLAQAVSNETRQRIIVALSPALDTPCTPDKATLHNVTLKTLIELIRSAGFASERVNYGLGAARITGSLTKKLATDEHILSVGVAADAMPGLTQAAKLSCSHGEDAKAILDALIVHDLMVWPKYYEGHHYVDTENWRKPMDAYVAEQVLAGNTDLLNRYLEGFAGKPEGLSGILYQLAAQAKTELEGARLFELWPIIMGKLLPNSRATTSSDRQRTPYRNTEELDKALLPLPSKGATWPPIATLTALRAWGHAYPSSPRLIDHLLMAMSSYGVALMSEATGFVLHVAGTDYERILRSSAIIVGWMRLILLGETKLNEIDRAKLVQFLDNLARIGDADALELQRDIER
jgi:hypothetical protein